MRFPPLLFSFFLFFLFFFHLFLFLFHNLFFFYQSFFSSQPLFSFSLSFLSSSLLLSSFPFLFLSSLPPSFFPFLLSNLFFFFLPTFLSFFQNSINRDSSSLLQFSTNSIMSCLAESSDSRFCRDGERIGHMRIQPPK
ncbi:uncharacterized protein B0T23DRAFT_49223 [Neurospora hispaniola]|uniref:Uncharacterized protein n=1 Tax=Neurospora hispaniola TaxID=588809 RepID=A0AAJ0HZ01_9PEZI|nr:hypothetical protein B0T23DRAFT_49223 [Neurospora hispaniola]